MSRNIDFSFVIQAFRPLMLSTISKESTRNRSKVKLKTTVWSDMRKTLTSKHSKKRIVWFYLKKGLQGKTFAKEM